MAAELIENIADMIANINTLEEYLQSGKEPEHSYAIGLIRRGTCFVKYSNGFYPSRFIGYKNNTMIAHENNTSKDGKVTNPRIGCLLGQMKPEVNLILDREYRAYCRSLGFESKEKGTFGVDRKYWEM